MEQPTSNLKRQAAAHPTWDNNIKKWGFDAHPVVAPVSGGLIILFIAVTLIFQESASEVFDTTKDLIAKLAGWFYIFSTNVYLGVVIFFGLSKFGNIRLGGPGTKPEFSTFAWFSMLFSAGMGIGLMFWSVAEPIYHLGDVSPFWGDVEPGSAAAAKAAMGTTFFHWGFHAWGIYCLVALALAFFAFNQGLPLTIRSIFYPIWGR